MPALKQVTMNELTLPFRVLTIQDLPRVGGKNASLGEMLNRLSAAAIPVPDGFATTALAFRNFLKQNSLEQPLRQLMNQLDRPSYSNLSSIGEKARDIILKAPLPVELCNEIEKSWQQLTNGTEMAVAVRSSATAEDLPEASFAGQHESYLNVRGLPAVLNAVHRCFASLYTDRAIKYREDHGFEHDQVALSAGVQQMVRSDLSGSGIIFTLEPESGFKDVIQISSVWGLGENIVQGAVTPDEYLLFKPALRAGFQPVIQKKLGDKARTLVYGEEPDSPLKNTDTSQEKRDRFVLSDAELVQLGKWALAIEQHYKQAMDLEWARDGVTDQLYIIQARPETVHGSANRMLVKEFQLLKKGALLCKGEAIGSAVSSGKARLLTDPSQAALLQEGEILVTDITSPDWDPVLKKSGGIVTNKGGRTSHASIVARELGVPAIVGCGNATRQIADGETITLSCSEGKTGYVYLGKAEVTEHSIDLSTVQKPLHTKVMLITADPEQAFSLSRYPADGVGLMRIEFVIMHSIQVHPMALVKFESLPASEMRDRIAHITRHFNRRTDFFVTKLAQAVACMAAAFYPREVIVRMSDFKSNEYRNLLGGEWFEPKEENPMIGFRGASRYYHELYQEGFKLECDAMRMVRDEMGLTNVKLMIPFCRSIEEGKKVLQVMAEAGLRRGKNGLQIYVMAEIPSNIILAESFAQLFDGFSIGSNDLTQLTLGVDRDSDLVSPLFDEKNEAALEMVSSVIAKAKKAGAGIGLCGQAPSDYPEYAQFLVDAGIDSISFNPDALMKGMENIRLAEIKKSVPAAESNH